MSAPDGYELVDIAEERRAEMLGVDEFAFAFTVPQREREALLPLIPEGRTRAVEVTDRSRGEVGSFAAVHASFAFQTRVPGGREVPTAGLTWVGVHPGHRRRGLLTAMMADHFSRSLARGEHISTLWAAETQIYQRFGYGLAGYDTRLNLGRGAELREVPGADDLSVVIDTADLHKHGEVFRSIQSRMMRPGTATQLTHEAVYDVFLDLESDREGAEQLRIAIVKDGDDPVAYALFQRKGKWTANGPEGVVSIRAVGSLSTAASRRLWSVLVDFDLMGVTEAARVAIDDPLVYLLKDMRTAKISLRDNLWVRVLDVPKALESRGYAEDCDVVIDLVDTLLPDNAGTWRVVVVEGDATVTRTDAPADLTMNIQELGALYLGGTTVTELWRAGLVEQRTDGAAQSLSRAMASDLKPVANFGF